MYASVDLYKRHEGRLTTDHKVKQLDSVGNFERWGRLFSSQAAQEGSVSGLLIVLPRQDLR